MTQFSAVSAPIVSGRSPRRRIAATLAAAAIATLTAAGCSSSAGHTANAQQALKLAAFQATKISSLEMTLDEQIGTTTTMSGTIQMRIKPSLLAQEDFSITVAGVSTTMSAIMNDQDFYLNLPQLTSVTGKTWAKISLSNLSAKSGVNFSQAIQQAENMNPGTTTRLFATSKDVRKVGPATVNGVQTTEYDGTFTAAQAIKQLPAALQKQLGSMLSSMGTSKVSFQVWIDSDSVARKMIEHMTIGGQAVVATVNLNSFNQPVSIVLPPASQVGTIPGL